MTNIDEIMKKKEQEEKAISDVISGMAFYFEQEDERKSADDIKKIVDYYSTFKDDDYYATVMYLICERFTKVPAKPWLMKYPHVQKWDKFIIESIFNGLFQHWFTSVNGHDGDQERFVVRQMLKAIANKENLSLYAEYKDKPGEQAYWSPRTFQDTYELKVKFVSWWRNEDMSKYVH